MKIFIMTDLEGVAGVQDSTNWCLKEGLYYSKARELLTQEVNAAIEGFIAAGAREILVADGHGWGAINPDRLHPEAQLARNWPASKAGTFSMEESRFDFMAFIGQHPMAGTVGGHLCHTGNMGVAEQTINGIAVGEYGNLVFTANELGIRVILATGCEAFCREAQALVPGVETVAVKKGLQTEPGNHLPAEAYREHNKAAIHIHPEEARRRIKAGSKRALERAQKEDFGLAKLPAPPYTRIKILRGTSTSPPRIFRQTHPDSLVEMHRAPYTVHELLVNPAAPEMKKLIGSRIK